MRKLAFKKNWLRKGASYWTVFLLMFLALGAARAETVNGTWQLVEKPENCKFFNPYHYEPSSTQWTGQCSNGFVQGKGSISYDTGVSTVRLTGDFDNGKLNGFGEFFTSIRRPDINKILQYMGEFQDSAMHGHGNLKFGEFGLFVGEFRYGLLDGPGVLSVDQKGHTFKISGYFKGTPDNTEVVGSGVMEVGDPSQYRYDGEFKGLEKHGRGTVTLPNGDHCEGEWRDGFFKGVGSGYIQGHAGKCTMQGLAIKAIE